MRLGLAILAAMIVFPASAEAYHRHSVDHHYLGQGELRQAQNTQPWAWSNYKEPTQHAAVAQRKSARVVSERSVVQVHSAAPSKYVGLSSECRVAASQGGPCGCFASEHFGLPRGYHGLNLWLANDWLHFPHVAPAAGTAAVWPGRHVAPVVAVNGDGTVTVRDSWATHNVRTAGLVFVAPN